MQTLTTPRSVRVGNFDHADLSEEKCLFALNAARPSRPMIHFAATAE
jgi:hypothetical protein